MCMKMPNFKKYIFSYIYIFSTFLFYYCVWRYSQVEHPQVGPDDYFDFGDDAFEFFSMSITYLASLCIGVALIIEMLVRKFVINKFCPNLKFSIKLKLPKKMEFFLKVIFYIMFTIASIPFIGTSILLIIFNAINIYEKYVYFLQSFLN